MNQFNGVIFSDIVVSCAFTYRESEILVLWYAIHDCMDLTGDGLHCLHHYFFLDSLNILVVRIQKVIIIPNDRDV